MFLVFFLSIVGFFAWYGTRQLLKPSNLSGQGRTAVVCVVVFIVLATPVTIFLRSKGIENSSVDIMAWMGYTGLGFMCFVVCFLVIRDIMCLIFTLLTLFHRNVTPPNPGHTGSQDHPPLPNPDRRRFLLNSVNAGILAGAGMVTGVGIVQARNVPDIRNVPVFINDLPTDLEDFRIVQITDIHVSPTIKKRFVQRIVDVVNTLSPDVVALTGDLVDGSVSYLDDDVTPLSNIQSRYGNYFVTGNHEYYSGVESWIEKIQSLGFTVLMNENRIITQGQGKILMAGVPDFHGGHFFANHRPDSEKAVYCAAFTHVKILLAHQPMEIKAASRAGFDLQISGHTHGGQFYPWPILVNMAQPYLKGLHKHNDTQIYVSSGTGYWGPPLRIGSRSEITLITLKNKTGVESEP